MLQVFPDNIKMSSILLFGEVEMNLVVFTPSQTKDKKILIICLPGPPRVKDC